MKLLNTSLSKVLALTAIVLGGLVVNYLTIAWTGPTATAPSINTPAPINAGGGSQTKTGDLTVDGNLVVNSAASVDGLVSYSPFFFHGGDGTLYFQSVTPPGGVYGAETVSLQTEIDGNTPGTYAGHKDRYVLALQPEHGNVGVGTTNPVAKLEVAGAGGFRIQARSNDPAYYTDFTQGYPGGLTITTKEWAQPDTTLSLYRGQVRANIFCDLNGNNCKSPANMGGLDVYIRSRSVTAGYSSVSCPSGYRALTCAIYKPASGNDSPSCKPNYNSCTFSVDTEWAFDGGTGYCTCVKGAIFH